jgi:hypothetical protein
MGISKCILKPGNKQQLARKYDEVAIEYTGNTMPSHDKDDVLQPQGGYSTLMQLTTKVNSKFSVTPGFERVSRSQTSY